MTKFQRINLLCLILSLIVFSTACGGWTSEANSVVGVLIAAIPMLVNILLAFAGYLPQPVLDAVSKWGAEAVASLEDVKKLIADFASAPDESKQGIVVQIQQALGIVSDNLAKLLPDLHVTNPSVQRLITLVVSEFSALLGLIPVIQGKVTAKKDVMKLHAALLDKEEFTAAWNGDAGSLGSQYTL